jgi:enoyl-CoA hydratase/carnithine racemase
VGDGLSLEWLDDEPNLSVAVITAVGKKAFSAGADLNGTIQWQQM